MKLYETTGAQHTEETLTLAVDKAMELKTDIVIASTLGGTAMQLVQLAKEKGYQGRIVVVRCCSSAAEGGVNRMAPEMKAQLQAEGAAIVSAAHALSAGERAISGTFKGQYPLEIIAGALRMLGAGTKVAVEISVMALDADEIPFGKPIVAVGGTGKGCDTAVVLTPSYSATLLQTKIHEYLCKPSLL